MRLQSEGWFPTLRAACAEELQIPMPAADLDEPGVHVKPRHGCRKAVRAAAMVHRAVVPCNIGMVDLCAQANPEADCATSRVVHVLSNNDGQGEWDARFL